MNFKVFHICFFFSLIFVSIPANAGKIKKGFEALEIHDYFKAKKKFTGGLKYNTSVAAYGLSKIYSLPNTPFYSKDSAYVYLELSEQTYATTKARKRLKWVNYGWTVDGILAQRRLIEDLYYQEAKSIHSIEGYTTFIKLYPRALQQQEVIATRDSMAFFQAVNANTAEAYNDFLLIYPTSLYAEIAQDNYFDSQFFEMTGDGSLASFIEFIQLNPLSPMIPYAEQEIFSIVTKPNTVEAFDIFIQTYPENHYVDSAWRQLYQAYISNYSDSILNQFKTTYPAYPFMSSLDREIEFSNSHIFPTIINNRFGFIDLYGNQIIDADYLEVTPFNEGLAVALKDGKYGVIDFEGKVHIPFKYDAISDFVDGLSLVEIGDQMGVMHRNGNLVLACEFEDLGMISDGLIYGSKNGKYGYYDAIGRSRIPEKYDDAFDFSNGIAKVKINGFQAYIDIYDVYVAQPAYAEIDVFSDSLFVFTKDGFMGLMDRLTKVVVEADFDEIGRLKEGVAIAVIDDEVVYLNKRGEIVIQDDFEVYPNFALKGEFLNGEAVAVKDEKYGRIDIKGNTVLSFKFDNIGIGETVIPFEKEGMWGVLNRSGKTLISAEYSNLFVANDTYVFATSNEGSGVMDLSGDIVVPFTYDNIELIADDMFIVRKGNVVGLYKDGAALTTIGYDSIGTFGEDFLFLSKPGELAYYDISTGRVVVTKIEESE